jgi:hypothetical protein
MPQEIRCWWSGCGSAGALPSYRRNGRVSRWVRIHTTKSTARPSSLRLTQERRRFQWVCSSGARLRPCGRLPMAATWAALCAIRQL